MWIREVTIIDMNRSGEGCLASFFCVQLGLQFEGLFSPSSVYDGRSPQNYHTHQTTYAQQH